MLLSMLRCGTKKPEGQRPNVTAVNSSIRATSGNSEKYMLWTMCEWYCNYIDDCFGTQETPKKASPEKKHGSQETGLDGTWSEELAPNALTWTQKKPQLNEPMHGTSLQITFKTTSKTYQVQESKVDSKVSRICASKCAKHPMHAWSHL